MTNDQGDLGVLRERIAALESRQRLITWAGIATVFASALVLVSSASFAQDRASHRTPPERTPTRRATSDARLRRVAERRDSSRNDEVKYATADDQFFGEGFNVVFAGDEIEAMLDTDVDLGPGLTFFDEAGEPRVLIGIDPGRSEAYFEMYNRRGRLKFARYAR